MATLKQATEQNKMTIKITAYTENFNPLDSAPCVVSGMPNDVYHSLPGISKSGLDKINKTPAHYKYGEFEVTKPMEIGTALHAAVLEPDVFASDFLMLPDVKDRRASEYKKACAAYDNVLVGKECDQITGMVDALNDNFKASELMSGVGHRELSVFVRDPVMGVLCKCRFDFISIEENGAYTVDLKTTSDANEEAFSASMARYRYYVQSAFYSDVWLWATGLELSRFWFIAVESKKPHGVICRYLDDESVQLGRDEYRANLNTYAECISNDFWPCYEQPANDDDAVISLPYWIWNQLENDIVEEIV